MTANKPIDWQPPRLALDTDHNPESLPGIIQQMAAHFGTMERLDVTEEAFEESRLQIKRLQAKGLGIARGVRRGHGKRYRAMITKIQRTRTDGSS